MRVTHDASGCEIELADENETRALGQALASISRPGLVFGLDGPLGAGKTRLTRAWAEALGVSPDAISSPTFILIHEYQGTIPVYHFDAYRLNSSDEFEAIGGPEYFSNGGGICLIEWADRVEEALPRDAIRIRIEPTGETRRRLRIEEAESEKTFIAALAARLADFDDSPSAN